MLDYGYWFYEELQDKVGIIPFSIRSENNYITLNTPNNGSFQVKSSSYRFDLFKKNRSCISCGRTGNLWILQTHHGRKDAHLNLYCVEEKPIYRYEKLSKDGLIMMTKDHIIPKSRGGANGPSNFACMCEICNFTKDNMLPNEINLSRHVKV